MNIRSGAQFTLTLGEFFDTLFSASVKYRTTGTLWVRTQRKNSKPVKGKLRLYKHCSNYKYPITNIFEK